MIKKIMYGLSLAMAIVLAACSQPAKPTKRSSEPSSSAAQTVSSTSAEKEQVQSIDGSYRGQDAESTILLVVTGQKEAHSSKPINKILNPYLDIKRRNFRKVTNILLFPSTSITILLFRCNVQPNPYLGKSKASKKSVGQKSVIR